MSNGTRHSTPLFLALNLLAFLTLAGCSPVGVNLDDLLVAQARRSPRLAEHLGLAGRAAAAGTALVVDLDPAGPAYPGAASLAELVTEGPRRSDLVPDQKGVAVLRNGGVTPEAADPVLQALVAGWPSVVLRVARREDATGRASVAPVHPLLPGWLAPVPSGPAVYQRTGFRGKPPGPGPVLPRPRPFLVASLLEGTMPGRSGWVRAWRSVWSVPWR